jgi:LacI family transcriptional regulator
MTTIRELAKLAGVSTATVIRALRDDRHIRPDTRDKVLELAALYAYESKAHPPPPTGTNLIGCIVPTVTSAVFSRVIKGALESAFAASYRVIVLETHSNVTHTCKALRVLREHGVAGIVIASGHDHRVPASEAMFLWSHGIHLVAADSNPFPAEIDVDCVENDFEAMTRLAIGYLYDLGHRSIAYVGRMFRDELKPLRRETSIRKAMQSYHLPTDLFIDIITNPDPDTIADQLLSRPDPPTALIAWSDPWAAQLANALTRRGCAIPETMSILGTGNEPFGELVRPTLSSIEQNFYDMGKRAVALLSERIASNESPASYAKARIIIPAHLALRASSARPCSSFRTGKAER